MVWLIETRRAARPCAAATKRMRHESTRALIYTHGMLTHMEGRRTTCEAALGRSVQLAVQQARRLTMVVWCVVRDAWCVMQKIGATQPRKNGKTCETLPPSNSCSDSSRWCADADDGLLPASRMSAESPSFFLIHLPRANRSQHKRSLCVHLCGAWCAVRGAEASLHQALRNHKRVWCVVRGAWCSVQVEGRMERGGVL